MLPPNSVAPRKAAPLPTLVRTLLLAAIAVLFLAILGGDAPRAQSLPGGWADQDIGAVGLPGIAAATGDTFTLQGAGADIWGATDSFHFANQALVGDGQIIVHVRSMQNTSAYAKAGVMIRETLTASSAHVILDVKPNGGVEFMTRATAGGPTSFIAGGTGSWLKLVRASGVFAAYLSNDGVTWTSIGSKAVAMGQNAWVGLVVCSHNTGVLNTAVFDTVSVAAASGPAPTVSITSPANGAGFAAGANISIGANASGGGATPVARVDFYANNGTSNALIGSDTASPYAVVWSNVGAGSYSLTAVATDTANQSTTSAPVGISVAAAGGGTLPAGWAAQDIGSVGLGGSASYSGGTFTVKGAGADIWGAADSFTFANQALAGDGEIVAHVASIANTNAFAKAGVMIRETLTAGSPHVILDVKPGGSVEFMSRATPGGPTSFIAGGTGTWLKLVRSNGVFTASVSPNGSTWTVIGSKAVSMGASAWVGLAVCSHNTSALNTSVFDSVVSGAAPSGGGGGGGPLPDGWSDGDIGSVGIAGSASHDNGVFTLKGGGADIWGSSDSFHFASRQLSGAGEIVAHVASMTNTNAFAKAGVMIRASVTNNSPHVLLDVKPNGAVEFLARASDGGPTAYLGGGTGSWLKIVRSGNSGFAAYVSSDNSTWQLIGSTAMTMPGSIVQVGLAVCSHNTGILNTAVFDNVVVSGSPTPLPPPAITSPPSGSTFPSGAAPVFTAVASEPGVTVDFYLDDGNTNNMWGTFMNPAGGRPYLFIGSSWNPGTYTVTAVAHYSTGWSTSSPVTIHITEGALGPEVPPSVTITSPARNSVWPVGSPVTITSTAADPDSTGVARVDYWLEEYGGYYNYLTSRTYLGGATTSPYAVTWTPTVAEDVGILAVVTDTAGLATASWTFLTIR